MRRQIVFLLGAGASVKAGIPPMIPFTGDFRSELNGDADLKELVPTLDAISNYWRQLHGQRDFDLEILYELLYMVNRPGFTMQNPLASAPPIPKGRRSELLEYYLKSYVQRRCLGVSQRKIRYLQPLVRFFSLSPELYIGSLNYDVCVEVFSAANKLPCITGFDSSTGLWRPQTLTANPSSTSSIKLLKMHGSVTWFETKPGQYEARSPVSSREEQVLFQSARGRTLERMLIYPGRSKLPLFGPYLKLIDLYRSILLDCRLCIAVGYRFGDSHLRNLFAETMAMNQKLSLLIVSPDAEAVADNLSQSLYRGVDTSRLISINRKFGYFERALRNDWLYDQVRKILASPLPGRKMRRTAPLRSTKGCTLITDQPLSGLALDSAGTIYGSTRQNSHGRIMRIDPRSGSVSVVFDGLKRPRGIVLDETTTSLFVIDNEIRVVANEPRVLEGIEGLGRLWRIDYITGDSSPVIPLDTCNSTLLRRLVSRSRADLRLACPALLSWPTALSFHGTTRVIATEARSLMEIDLRAQTFDRFVPFTLPFNICAIESFSARRLIVLDSGVTDLEIGTGRLFFVDTIRRTNKKIAELGPLATSVALAQDKNSIYVSHNLPAPRGCVAQVEIKSGRVVSKYEGFNGVGALRLLPTQDTLLVSTKAGLYGLDVR